MGGHEARPKYKLASVATLSAAFLEFIPWIDKTAVRPVSVKPSKFFQFLWMLGGNIVDLRPLGCHIVEFPITGELAN